MKLPAEVVEKDRTLQRSADQLMELRWHWTLDESNHGRVSQREYARQVGVDHKRVNIDANAWADYLAAGAHTGHILEAMPGEPQTPDDFRQMRKLGAERQEAVKAVARTQGVSVSNVAVNKREEVDAVLNTARRRAEDRGTTIEHEVDRAAEWREKTRRSAAASRETQRSRHTLRYLQAEGKLGKVSAILRDLLDESRGVDWTLEEHELLVETLDKVKGLLALLDMSISGTSGVDWNAELEKLT